MNKTRRVLLTLLLTLTLTACETQSAATNVIDTPYTTSPPASAVVKFADPVLESMVRGAMGKPEGEITLAEAQGVTRMDLTDSLQRQLSETTPVTNLSGLEAFTNLESLDLSQNAVTDISPLSGLTKLTALSLAGNPVTDVAPLAKLTNLKLLILSNCQAKDYSVLSNLTNLQVLLLDNSTISDVSPLASLTNLQTLYLDKSSAEDFSSLENIYTTLANKDFIIPNTLKDLGFNLDLDRHEATYESEDASFTINHEKWGPPSREDNLNIIRMSLYMNDVYKISIGYYSVHKVYVVQIDKEGEQQANYLYNLADGSTNLSPEDLTNAEKMARGAMDLPEGEDVLAAPILFYNDSLKNTFKMTPEKLFTLPYEPLTLKSLGFVPDETPGIYMYEEHEGIYTNIRIDHNEKENKEYDVVFFQPITDIYRVNLFYHTPDNKLFVGADDNYNGGASFYYYLDTGEHIDEWCSDNNKTVEEYFTQAYNDPSVTDVYQKTVDLMTQYINNNFGMSIEELYALPVGDY
jgi:hypothetical protein